MEKSDSQGLVTNNKIMRLYSLRTVITETGRNTRRAENLNLKRNMAKLVNFEGMTLVFRYDLDLRPLQGQSSLCRAVWRDGWECPSVQQLHMAVERKSFGRLMTVTSQEAPFLRKPLVLALPELVSSCIMGTELTVRVVMTSDNFSTPGPWKIAFPQLRRWSD